MSVWHRVRHWSCCLLLSIYQSILTCKTEVPINEPHPAFALCQLLMKTFTNMFETLQTKAMTCHFSGHGSALSRSIFTLLSKRNWIKPGWKLTKTKSLWKTWSLTTKFFSPVIQPTPRQCLQNRNPNPKQDSSVSRASNVHKSSNRRLNHLKKHQIASCATHQDLQHCPESTQST